MGLNSTLIILNDGLHQISEDKDFGQKVADAIQKVRHGKPEVISSGSHANVAYVVETHHADYTSIVAVGGNHATQIGTTHGTTHHHKDETQIEILKQLAEKMGYRLVKKRKTKE